MKKLICWMFGHKWVTLYHEWLQYTEYGVKQGMIEGARICARCKKVKE
jgi:hypothetical protein